MFESLNKGVCHGWSRQIPQFMESEEAPWAPSDPLFQFEDSVISIPNADASAAALGNAFLDFVKTTTAAVSKVSLKKYSVKADVFIDGVMCTVKMRIYKQMDAHILEFQRRCGCAFVFSKVFRSASQFMVQRFAGHGDPMCDVPPFATPCPLGTDKSLVLDLVHLCKQSHLQAEAASALSCLDPKTLDQFDWTQVLCVIEILLNVEQLDVAFPVAQFVLQSAMHPEFVQRLNSRGILATVRNRSRCSNQMSELLRFEFVAPLVAAAA